MPDQPEAPASLCPPRFAASLNLLLFSPSSLSTSNCVELRPCGTGALARSGQPSGSAILSLLLYLFELQLHRSRTSENRDHHLQGFAVFIHIVHDPSESREGPFANPHRLALFKFDFELRPIFRLACFINNVLHF